MKIRTPKKILRDAVASELKSGSEDPVEMKCYQPIFSASGQYVGMGIPADDPTKPVLEWAGDTTFVKYEDAYSWGVKKIESLIAERDALAEQLAHLERCTFTTSVVPDGPELRCWCKAGHDGKHDLSSPADYQRLQTLQNV